MESRSNNELASPEVTSSNFRFVIAGFCLLANLAVGLNWFAASPLLPLIIEDYSIGRATAGLMVTLAMLLSAGFGLPGGVVIAWMGLRRAFMAGWLLVSLLVLSTIAPNFATMLVLRVAFGLGVVLLYTSTGPLLMQWFKPREILIMNGLNTAVMSLGIALSVATAAPLSSVVGWAGALSLFGAVGVVGALAWIVLGRPVRNVSRLVPIVSRRELWAVISNRAVLLLVAADTGALFQYTALTSWLPSFYHEARSLSLNQAGIITGLLPFVGIFAVLVGGLVPARLGSKKMFFLVSGVLVLLGGPGAFLFDNLAGIYLSVIVVGIGSWLYVPILLSLPMELPGMTPEKVAIVWGFMITSGSIGMFLSPLLVGGLRDVSGSFIPGFAICAVAACSLLVAGLFIPETTPQPRR